MLAEQNEWGKVDGNRVGKVGWSSPEGIRSTLEVSTHTERHFGEGGLTGLRISM